jgi:hypothetical protein
MPALTSPEADISLAAVRAAMLKAVQGAYCALQKEALGAHELEYKN